MNATLEDKVNENPVSQPETKSGDRKFIIWASVIVSLIVLLLIFITLLLLDIVDLSRISKDNDKTVSNSSTSSTSSQSSTDNIIDVTKPLANDVVDGKILVAGKATAKLEQLEIKVYDENNNELGTAEAILSSDNTDPVHNWSVELNVIKSSTSATGVVKIYPKSEGFSSELAREINVKFDILKNERIAVYGPMKNQLMQGTSIVVNGQMKDFFEATMNFRFKDESGNTIADENVIAKGDNYQNFADFEKTVNYGLLTGSNGSKGVWEFYEISAMDGSEKILGTVNVRLK